jgi:hypothetical protein
MTQRELPALAGIAAVIRWFESLILLVAGPLLTIGLGVAVVDLATNNALLNSVPWLLVAWGIAMAIGLDAQVIAAWDRVGVAFRQRQWLVLTLYLVVGVALGYVGYIACAVFGFEHALGYSEAVALNRMGVDATLYQYQRAFLAVALVALSALNRYHPPQVSLAEERAELHRELELTPLKQRLTEMKAVGAVNLTRSVAATAAGKAKVKHATPPRFPTGGGSPSAVSGDGQTSTETSSTLALVRPAKDDRKMAILGARERVYKLLAKNPNLSKSEIARLAHVSETTASKWRTQWRVEVGGVEEDLAN